MPAKVCKPDTGSCAAAEMVPARSTAQVKTLVLNRFMRISLEVWTFQRESVARRSRANLSTVMSGPKPRPQRIKNSPSAVKPAAYCPEGGKYTDDGARNSTPGAVAFTLTLANLPFAPPLPAIVARYWLLRC